MKQHTHTETPRSNQTREGKRGRTALLFLPVFAATSLGAHCPNTLTDVHQASLITWSETDTLFKDWYVQEVTLAATLERLEELEVVHERWTEIASKVTWALARIEEGQDLRTQLNEALAQATKYLEDVGVKQ